MHPPPLNDDGEPDGETTYSHTRAASNAKVGVTVFHVPGDPDLTLRANNDVDYGKWPYLYPNAKDKNDDKVIAGDEIGAPFASVWTLPDCEPGVTPTPHSQRPVHRLLRRTAADEQLGERQLQVRDHPGAGACGE